jgi:serum/glucocorticoid-regulated kinase 2
LLEPALGGELFSVLRARTFFDEDTARFYAASVVLAFEYMHSKNIIYRDLKPENILLDDSGHVCLTDFGLSKDYDPDNPDDKAHTFCGTPEYLAPEIVSGVGHDKAVDWWSLGILLYELTVGIPPFYAQNVNEMYTKIQTGVLRFPPFVSDDCKALIVGLLQRDPKKRLGSENDVDDIKRMAFFKPINWERLMRKEIESPYKPRIKSAGDTSNFDETFTAEPAVDSVADRGQLSKTLAQNQDAFSGFTFTQQSNLK